MSLLFYILAALLIYFSLKSVRGGFVYLNYFKQELAKHRPEYTPFAAVIAPCKGLDEGLAENLAALLEQDHPDYEVIFVVDDEDDPATGVITRVVSRKDAKTQGRRQAELDQISASSRLRGKTNCKLVIAPKATDSGQKVENIREAVLYADERSQVFVFVDSDARPARDWLRRLVAPLEDDVVGVATGYRWFISERPTFASELRSAWNASIASALGPKSSFCWAGSMAIRRDVFDRLDVRGRLRGTVSDDFTIARVMKEAGLDIRFVPRALTPSMEGCTFRGLLEFTTRQMKLTRVYAAPLWAVSFFGSGLFTFVMLSAILIVVFGERGTLLTWAAIFTLGIVAVCSIGKAWLRLRAAALVIPEAAGQVFPQITLWLLAQPLFLYNCVLAWVSRELIWRGIRYRLVSHNQTVRLD